MLLRTCSTSCACFQPARATTQITYRANLAQIPRTANYQQGSVGSELLFNPVPTSGFFQSSTAFGTTGPFDVDDAINATITVDGTAHAVVINRAAVMAVGSSTTSDTAPTMWPSPTRVDGKRKPLTRN